MKFDGLRIINVVPSVSQDADGVATFVRGLAETLFNENVDARISALDWAPSKFSPGYLNTFPLGWGPRNLGRSPLMKKWLINEIRSGQVDVVHNHGLWMMPNVYVGNVRENSRCRLMFSPHGALSTRALSINKLKKTVFWKLFQGRAAIAATCFHATAESEYEDIRRFGIRQPVCILPGGVYVPEMQRKKMAARKELLYLARIHPIKGVENLVLAWSVIESKFPDWSLVIAGPDSGAYLRSIKELSAKFRLKRVEFRGPLYGDSKHQAFRDASLYVLPSYSENFGLTVAEALSAGTPAIVTRGAPWEGLETHGAGWWVDFGIDALVDALDVALSQSGSRLQEMGEAGYRWMKSDFSLERVGLKFLDTYNWMRQGGETPPWIKLD